MLRTSMIAILLTGACSSTPTATQTTTTEPTIADAGAARPLVIRGRGGRGRRPASWLEEPLRDGAELILEDLALVAVGSDRAIISTNLGAFTVDSPRGVRGPLTLPEATTWLGVGGRNDAIFAADGDGVLYRADSPSRELTRVNRIAGARLWDAAPGLIVAAVADRVHVSANGDKFKATRSVGRGLVITALFARHDGVLVARARDRSSRHKVLVSRDRKRWRTADYQPEGLSRRGAWIASGTDGCIEVLASDGRRWIRTDAGAQLAELNPWLRNLDHDEYFVLHPRAEHLTAITPPAPTYVAAQDAERGQPCAGRAERVVGPRGRVLGRVRDNPLDPIRGTVFPRPPITRTAITALGDGHCAVKATGECDLSALPVRMPHVLALDRDSGRLRLLNLPDPCVPERADAVAGLGLLLCRQGLTLQAHTLTGNSFVAEKTLDIPTLETIGVAHDGSIGLASCRYDGCKLFIRIPIAAGMGGGWRELEVANAVAFRLLSRGRVLVVVEEHGGSEATDFSLVLSRPGANDRTLTPPIRVEGFVEALDVDTEGQVFITLSKAGGGPASRWLIAEDGSLIASD